MNNTPSLLPPNSTTLERAVEQSQNRTTDLNIDIAKLWNPDTCPIEQLPWLAWTLSVDYWKSNWTDQVKRNVVRAAIINHRKKGTLGSVRRAIEALGTRLHISEWFNHGGDPYTVKVTAYVNEVLADGAEIISRELMIDLLRILEHHAPVRVHFDLEVGADYQSGLSTAAVLGRATSLQTFIASTKTQEHHPGTGSNSITAILPRPVTVQSNHFVTQANANITGTGLLGPIASLIRPIVIASFTGVIA
ncbi:MAG: phage tail protein I [Oceanospirillaceae bacterium]|nr:phage tail protein I [Oceanospirillaceae bacterium]